MSHDPSEWPSVHILGPIDHQSGARYSAMRDIHAQLSRARRVPNDGLVEGFSPNGHHVLYLRNHGPVQLWTGTITAARISSTTELLANADLGSVSW